MDQLSNEKRTGGSFDTSTKSRLVVKIALVLSVLMFLGITTSGLWMYQKNVDLILMNLQNQLQLAANTIAISIDGEMYQKLRGKESVGTPEYREIYNVLEQFVRFNRDLGFERECVYTFRRISEDSLEFTVMLQDQYVGNRYPVREEMLPTWQEGKSSYTGIYRDENGTWVSAYAPILNRQYQVVGIVEVDFKDNVYLIATRDEIFFVILFSLAGIGFAILIAVLLNRLITKPIIRISKAAIRFSSGEFNVSVPVTTNDEIGMLARAFNYMVKEIKEKEFIRLQNKELREAYAKLDALNQSLQEANRLKSEFLSIAAHDLKSPLQVISGFAEMITNTPGQHPDVYRNAGKIHRATQRMLVLIKNLLDTTAIESGKFKLSKELTDISVLAGRIVENNRALAERKEQQLILSTERECSAYVDVKRISEVMDNLVNNAIKFSPAGEIIRVDVQKLADGKDNNEKVQFIVKDNGPGLSKEDKRKLFGKFMRLSAQPTGGEPSTGLGLSIVKQVVELHGGKVWAESEGKEKGATFVVELGEKIAVDYRH
jgi:signal transduction histidine kinase